MTQRSTPSSAAFAERLDAARGALVMLLGDQFPPTLALARARISARMVQLGMHNPFSAAVELARCHNLQDDSAPLLLLVAALDLIEQPRCKS